MGYLNWKFRGGFRWTCHRRGSHAKKRLGATGLECMGESVGTNIVLRCFLFCQFFLLFSLLLFVHLFSMKKRGACAPTPSWVVSGSGVIYKSGSQTHTRCLLLFY